MRATFFDANRTYIEGGHTALEFMSDGEFHAILCTYWDSTTLPHRDHYTLDERVRLLNQLLDETPRREQQGYPTLRIEESGERVLLRYVSAPAA